MQKLLRLNLYLSLKIHQFISALTRTLSDNSGADGLASGTQSVLSHTVKHEDGRRLIFLDTPGFNNIRLTDAEILQLVDRCLKTKYVVIRYCIDIHR